MMLKKQGVFVFYAYLYPANINPRHMDDITEYRSRILRLLLQTTGPDGQPRLTERQARQLMGELTDEDLRAGMDVNTPEEVAELLLESGLA